MTILTGTLIGLGVILLILLYSIYRKGRKITGEHVFRASRWSKGNRVYPAQVSISRAGITLYKPQWVGKVEESIHMAHVASVKIDTNIIFSEVFIETTGGTNQIVCRGHTKGDAVKMKQTIESYQSDYYKKPAAAPAATSP